MPSSQTAATDDSETSGLLTVDELAVATGTTVRNTRYYAGLGLLPPPQRRGRMAYYTGVHKARLELIRALQEHGFTLAAIERYFSRLPEDASAEALAAQRVMLTSWKPSPTEVLTRSQLERRVGDTLSDDEVELMVRLQTLRVLEPGRYEVLTDVEAPYRLIRLGLPVDSLLEANTAIARHMEGLADELTEVLRSKVVAPFRQREHTEEDTARFEEMMTELRELTMTAVVSGYQRAADEVIRRSLTR
ncbi:transcriptional regulator [Marmoricola endophyticus]|uniref:Transcriptional regulator n=1 Tax=Marmoricola endophyticus TaxID=2040280 RepID=A0A917BSH1_9ACTN|nr:MerR family transcriptional regulator [Marmoricola endophyticus]GGF55164.1 transcriptional regulator [Marmoricola endophyticus]